MNFPEILGLIEKFQDAVEVPWYRGCSKASYTLLPSIARHPTKKTFADIYPVEKEMESLFSQRSRPLLQGRPDDKWDSMFLMQHYGLPTRLMDWSSNPFVALFFALKPRRGGYVEDAIVWMCDPEAWNASVMPLAPTEPRILSKDHRRLGDYMIGSRIDQFRAEPLMINGSYNSPRLIAQRGGFTVFGNDFRPFEEIHGAHGTAPPESLQKIAIKKSDCENMFKSLVKKGITETFVYPDIFGLAEELSRTFGFRNG